MKKRILEELQKIEKENNVKILLAVESGSRAWGFASPDSDYDVRFIYVRKKEDYLRLDKVKSIIEWRLDDVLDITGWDLMKTLQLLHNSNPSVFEWCNSPIIYYEAKEFSKVRELLPKYFSVKKNLYHYQHMADTNYREYLKGDMVRVKKYFYVLRPILAAKWVLDKRTAPPMLFDDLVAAEMDKGLIPELNKLLEMKKTVSELGVTNRIESFNQYIEKELPELKKYANAENEKEMEEWKDLNDLFLYLVNI